jgi:CIC family chloride channel protein
MRFLATLYHALRAELGRSWNDRAQLVGRWREFAHVLVVGALVGIVAFAFHGFVEKMEHMFVHSLLDYDQPRPARAMSPEERKGHLFANSQPDADQPSPAHSPASAERAALDKPSVPIHPTLRIKSAWIVLVPALGGLIVGFLTLRLAKEYQGEGTDVAIHAVHHRDGYVPAKVTATKLFASAVTVGTGGSSGLEGPIAQGGSGIGSWVGEKFKLPPEQRRRLAVAGMAAGVGAVFRVPLGGAFYAVEVLYRDNEFEGEALLPSFMASIIAYSIYCPLTGQGWGALFQMPPLGDFNVPLQLIYYALLAVALAFLGGLFVRAIQAAQWLFKPRKPLPRWLRPALGGLLLGILALYAPNALGSGYGYLQDALEGRYAVTFMLAMCALKIIATALTLGSGGAGGAFAPALVIGGMLGGVFGVVGVKLGIMESATPMILVGMAGFFGAVAKAPVAALIMASEMTSGYGLLVPLMTVTGLTYLLLPRFATMYHSQVANRRESPAHRGDYIVDVLRELRVADLVDREAPPPLVPMETTLDELNLLFTRASHETIPVVDESGKMQGVIYLGDIKEHLLTADFGGLILAADIMRLDFEPIRLAEDASQALGRLIAGGCDELPVVEEANPGVVIGSLSRADIMRVYYQRMNEFSKKRDEDDEAES